MRLYDQVVSDDVMMMVLMILMLRCPHHELLLAPVFCPAVSINCISIVLWRIWPLSAQGGSEWHDMKIRNRCEIGF